MSEYDGTRQEIVRYLLQVEKYPVFCYTYPRKESSKKRLGEL